LRRVTGAMHPPSSCAKFSRIETSPMVSSATATRVKAAQWPKCSEMAASRPSVVSEGTAISIKRSFHEEGWYPAVNTLSTLTVVQMDTSEVEGQVQIGAIRCRVHSCTINGRGNRTIVQSCTWHQFKRAGCGNSARPDLWGARAGNRPSLPDTHENPSQINKCVRGTHSGGDVLPG
jgi:hypothetical protein